MRLGLRFFGHFVERTVAFDAGRIDDGFVVVDDDLVLVLFLMAGETSLFFGFVDFFQVQAAAGFLVRRFGLCRAEGKQTQGRNGDDSHRSQ